MMEDLFILALAGGGALAFLLHMDRRYTGSGRAGVNLTSGERALIGVCVAVMIGLALLLALLPEPVQADTVRCDGEYTLTDQPADFDPYRYGYRDDGSRFVWRELGGDYQVFAGNGPEMFDPRLCLDVKGDDDE